MLIPALIEVSTKIPQSPKTDYPTMLKPLSQANKLRISFLEDSRDNAIIPIN